MGEKCKNKISKANIFTILYKNLTTMPIDLFNAKTKMLSFKISSIDAEQIPKVIEKIQHLHTKELASELFNELCIQFDWLISKIPLPMHYIDSSFIVRSRENLNGEIFTEQWQISYHSRNYDKITSGRFNRPQEPMFYGALKSNDHKGDSIATSTLESCKRILDAKDTSTFYDFTLGKWIIKEQFHVINLLYHKQTMIINPLIDKYLEGYFVDLEQKLSKKVCNYIRYFVDFLSNIASISKPTLNDYLISNAFWVSMRDYYKRTENTSLLGIVYPSWITEFNGVNIVLTPNAVDNYLHLESVGMYRFKRDVNNQKKFLCAPIYEDLIPVVDSHFSIPPLTIN